MTRAPAQAPAGGAPARAGGAGADAIRSPRSIPGERAELAREGRSLWERHRCAGCHDAAAADPGVVAVPLRELAARHSIESLAGFLATPTPPMPVFALAAQERRALAVYLLEPRARPREERRSWSGWRASRSGTGGTGPPGTWYAGSSSDTHRRARASSTSVAARARPRAALRRFGDVSGLDMGLAALRHARARGLAVARGSAENLPVGDAQLDVVVALDVLEHLDDDRRALDEILRVLRPGGVLLATVPAYPFLWSSHDEALGHRRRYRRARAARAHLRRWLRDRALLLRDGVDPSRSDRRAPRRAAAAGAGARAQSGYLDAAPSAQRSARRASWASADTLAPRQWSCPSASRSSRWPGDGAAAR